MNAALLVGGGALVAYLLLRARDAAAAAAPVAPTSDAQPSPVPQVPQPVPTPASPKPSQITIPAKPFPGEVAKPSSIALIGRWVWPLPRYGERAPVISDGFGSPRPAPHLMHKGVDLMFARISSDRYPPNSANGAKHHIMPDDWLTIAASDGVLWSATKSPRGYQVVIDHGTVATYYQHLELLVVPEIGPPAKGTPRANLLPIKAGQPLGFIGGDPLVKPYLKHLHFELWPNGPASAIDPRSLMMSWHVLGPDDVSPALIKPPGIKPAPSRLAPARQALIEPWRNAKRAPGSRDRVSVRAHDRAFPGAALHPPR